MKSLRETAMNYLARREHSRHELRVKLMRHGHDESAVDEVLEQLIADNLQSDLRFAQAYLQSRVSTGFGPLRIKQELQFRGVKDIIIEQVMFVDETFWDDALLAVWSKKYHRQLEQNQKDQARQFRFLMSRGFPAEAIHSLFKMMKKRDK